MKVLVADIPCGSCTACCQNDAVFLHPEYGDPAEDYITEEYEGRIVLAHKENGDCIYLDRKRGCTIHDRAPAVCRELDCRCMLTLPPDLLAKLLRTGELRPSVLKAAKRLKKTSWSAQNPLKRLTRKDF